MSAKDPSDEDLMRAYVAGDHEAFQALFDRYAPIVFGMTRRHLRNEDLAREITQQTFFRLHAARNDFRLDSRLRPWLLTIAMNLVREHWRRGKRRKMVELDPETKAAPQAERSRMELDERSKLLHAALAKLPESQREVVELHWFQERPYKEVAEIVGSSEGAVRVRAHRAYRKLEALLEGEVGKE
ncbi:MAG: RNA polymerase sigma factor [Myxococcota bacterium]